MRRMVGAAILVAVLGSATVVGWFSSRDSFTAPEILPATLSALDTARVAAPPSPYSPAIPARFPLQPLAFLSSAPAESLEALPGVGPVLATRLIDARRTHGAFRSWNDVDRVRGIGPKTIERLKALGRSR